jgi:hypothetical protein
MQEVCAINFMLQLLHASCCGLKGEEESFWQTIHMVCGAAAASRSTGSPDKAVWHNHAAYSFIQQRALTPEYVGSAYSA